MRDVPPELVGKAIGARLRELRKDAELSQRQLALRVGNNRVHVARAERGVLVATVETVQRYARALEVEPGVIWVALDPTWPTTAEVIRAA